MQTESQTPRLHFLVGCWSHFRIIVDAAAKQIGERLDNDRKFLIHAIQKECLVAACIKQCHDLYDR